MIRWTGSVIAGLPAAAAGGDIIAGKSRNRVGRACRPT